MDITYEEYVRDIHDLIKQGYGWQRLPPADGQKPRRAPHKTHKPPQKATRTTTDKEEGKWTNEK